MRYFTKSLTVLAVLVLTSCSGTGVQGGLATPQVSVSLATPAAGAALAAPKSGVVPLNLTQSVFPEVVSPSWSPDGQRVLFVAEDPTQGNHRELFTIQRDGTGLVRLTHTEGNNILPQWSPDGQQVLFTYQFPDGGNAEIFSVSADGAELQQLTKNSAYDWDATWSPIGNKIAFLSNRGGKDGLYVMDPDGSNVSEPGDMPAGVTDPSWHPDGMSLIFSAPASNGTASDLYTFALSAPEPVQVTNGAGYKGGAQWSLDGKRLLYSAADAIYVMDPDGSNSVKVSAQPSANYAAVWSPDGTMIAFQGEESGDSEIFVVNADGSNLRTFPHPGMDDLAPQWSPDGQQLLFLSHVPHNPRTDVLLIGIGDLVAHP